MMALKAPPADVGVIVGRFQVHELHEAHRALIDTVRDNHDHVIVFIGLSPLRNTTNNPLDFNARKRMFQEAYNDIEVHYVEDVSDDELWSTNLDREIIRWTKPHQKVMLYGSRDSFVSHYHGKFPTTELESETFISGTEIRRRIANHFTPSKEFRAGMIAASFSRFPTSYATVDVAIIKSAAHGQREILLAKKTGEKDFRFVGGFADPSDKSYEATAIREIAEETGLGIDPTGIHYVGSAKIDDWRYRGELDAIKTTFFIADHQFGRPEAKDDIASVTWVNLDDLLAGSIIVQKEHRVLVEMLKEYFIRELAKTYPQ